MRRALGCPEDDAGRCAAAMIDFLGASSKGYFQASALDTAEPYANTDSQDGADVYHEVAAPLEASREEPARGCKVAWC